MSESSMWQEGPSLGGCTEWKLPNGFRLLLLPDPSQPTITINMTVLVGSRHERRGERGMAHFLEHMLFKGTKSIEDIPRALRQRGAKFNGTTWLDRTHYYETLPATQGQLEFAIQLEAERFSTIKIEDDVFRTEREVIRNELLRGENNPSRVLFHRLKSAMYPHHGYGHPTIGLLDDLDAMTAEDLQDFYRRYYTPARTVLVVSGDVESEQVKERVAEHFHGLKGEPYRREATEIHEPNQDGGREIRLRRVSEINELAIAHRVPAARHPDFAAARLISYILGLRPTGRLYRELVEQGEGASVSSMVMSLHDPGFIVSSVDVTKAEHVEKTMQKMVEIVEQELSREISEDELARARNEFLKRHELELAEGSRVAIALTEAIAVGDWQHYFRQAEKIASVSREDVQRVARLYLRPDNRTTAILPAGNEVIEVDVPRPNDIPIADPSASRIQVSVGERFEPMPMRIEERVRRASMRDRFHTAFLERRTRNDLCTLSCNVRIGDEQRTDCRSPSINLLAEWMARGTKRLDYVAWADEFRRMRGWLSTDGFRGGISLEGQVPRRYLPEFLGLLQEVLQEPALERDEFDVLKKSALSAIDQRRTQPAVLASNRLRRELTQFELDDARHVNTLQESKQQLEEMTAEDLVESAGQLLGGEFGELVLVGPNLEPAELEPAMDWAASWSAIRSPQRIVELAATHDGGETEIEIKGKSNIGFSAGHNLALNDEHPDYPSLVLANYVFGGATLVSRLSSEIRGRRGLSYSIYSSLTAHAIDARARFTITAETNPENRRELIDTVKRELERWVNDGLTGAEIESARESLMSGRRIDRSSNRNLARMLGRHLFAGRTLAYSASVDERLQELEADEVNQAVRRWISPERLFIVTAGELVVG